MFRIMLFFYAVLFTIILEANGIRPIASCPQLRFKFGRVRYRQKGRFVKFQCNTGYILAGEKYSTCIRGQWDSPLPKCVRPTCPRIKPPVNGLIYPSHRGAVLNFFCKSGYELRGPNITFCEGRFWDNNLPSCVETNSKPALSCDFESEDLCGWTQDLRHDFDWLRINSATPSSYLGTGPRYDHTKGQGGNGYYMYIESSSRNENDTARLISPVYDKTVTNTCFKFFYHMYGASMGSLRVYVKKFSDSWTLDPNTAVFNRSGNHGDQWLEGFIRLGPIDQDFQIIIEGVNGPSYISDLAIDDVQLIENCTKEEQTATVMESYDTNAVASIESCLNRCDNDNLIFPEETSFQIACDCDEFCTDKNSCCPDYIALCIIGGTDDVTTAYQTTMSLELFTEKVNVKNQSETQFVKNITKKVDNGDTETNSVLPKSEINDVQDKKTYNYSKPVIPSKRNVTTVVNPQKVTQTKMSTVSQNISTTPIKPLLPTLIFLTPPVTKPIIRKIPTTLTPTTKRSTERPITKPTTERPTTKPTTERPTTKPTTERPTTKPLTKRPTTKAYITSTLSALPPTPTKSTTKGKTILIDEIVTVPAKSIEEILTPLYVTSTEEESKFAGHGNRELDMLYSSSDTKNEKIVIQSSNTDSKFTVVLISSIAVVLIGIICAVFIVRRFSVTGCRRISRLKSGGDSQSDVRFLTSDEQLDFTLARPDDFNRL